MGEVRVTTSTPARKSVSIYGDEGTGEVWRFDTAMGNMHPLGSIAFLVTEVAREDEKIGPSADATPVFDADEVPARIVLRSAMRYVHILSELLTGHCESMFEVAFAECPVTDNKNYDDEDGCERYCQDTALLLWETMIAHLDKVGRESMKSVGTIR